MSGLASKPGGDNHQPWAHYPLSRCRFTHIRSESYAASSLRPYQTTRFHRGHLHAALLAHVPRCSIHLGKSVVRAEASEEEAVLFFSDGTEAHGDLLIAADGIRSRVRQPLLPDYHLKFTGKVFARSTFDASSVEGKIPGLPLDAVHWWGPSNSFFASKLGKGQYTTVGAYQDSRSGEQLDKAITWTMDI
ncbi:hypothetical protein ARSEF4850_003838 [Beauveria asiatica]